MKVLKKLSFFLFLLPLLLILVSSSNNKALAQDVQYSVGGLVFIDTNGNGSKDNAETKCLTAGQSANLTLKAGSVTNSTYESLADCTRRYSITQSAQNRSVSISLPATRFRITGLTKIDDNGRQVLGGGTKSVGVSGTNASVNFGVQLIGSDNPAEIKCDEKPVLSKEGQNVNGRTTKYKIYLNNPNEKQCLYRFSDNLPSGWVTIYSTPWSSSSNTFTTSIAKNSKKEILLTVTRPSGVTSDKDFSFTATTITDDTGVKNSLPYTNKYDAPTNPPTTDRPSPTCDRNTPGLEIIPSNRNGRPGDEKVYDVKVINKDTGSSCDPVTFVLSKERLPNTNWTGRFDDNTLNNIGKNGGSQTTKYHVKSPAGATDGPKTITVGVRRQGQTVALKTVNVTYTVQDNTPVTNTPTPTNIPVDCVANNPSITVNPESVSLTKGSEATYTVKVKNMDTGTCADRNLSMQRIIPTAWTGEWSPAYQFTLAKGAEKTYTLSVKSSATANLGTYPITINVKNSSNVNISTKNVNYVVTQTNECQKSAPEFSITPQTKSGNAGEEIIFNLKVKNTDQGPCENRNFSLEVVPPSSEWNPSFSDGEISLAPGQEKDINVGIKSPIGTNPGTYNTVLWLLENGSRVSSIVAIYQVNDAQITPIPGKTYLNFKIGIDGIGTTPRIPIGGNKNPNSMFRGLNFRIYNAATNTLNYTGTNITFTYSQSSEKFELLYDLPSDANVPDGVYNFYINGPRFLTNQYPGSITITNGQTTNMTSSNFYLITGNVNNEDLSENRIDYLDYSLLLSCSIYSQDTTACDEDPKNIEHSDLNDDGIVNEDDYTLFLKEYANQEGIILPE